MIDLVVGPLELYPSLAMALLRSSRTVFSRLAASSSSSYVARSSSAHSLISNHRCFQSSSSSPPVPGVAPWRSLLSPCGPRSAGVALVPLPVFFNVHSRSYAKRPKKWQGGPYAFVQVEPGVPIPPYQPNEGSVKNRKHKKRMAQRDAFAKAQAQRRKEETKAAVIARDAARRKRWREATARARVWALQQARAATEQEAKPSAA